ncbi:hypothetical protein [Peribacillus sp. SCS-155]
MKEKNNTFSNFVDENRFQLNSYINYLFKEVNEFRNEDEVIDN